MRSRFSISHGRVKLDLAGCIHRRFSEAMAQRLEGEDILHFIEAVNLEGNALRKMLDEEFKTNPRPYSCSDSISWKVYIIGSIPELLAKHGVPQ